MVCDADVDERGDTPIRSRERKRAVAGARLKNNDPVDLNFELIDNEARYRSVGLTNAGRLLSVVWTIRKGEVRAITAFPASVSDRKAFLERPQ